MSFIPDACDTQVPSEAQIEAAWRAFENCPIDLVGDSDEEQKKCVIAAVKAALASHQPAMGLDNVADIIRDKVYADENDKVGGVYDAAQRVIEYITALCAKPPAAPVETLDFETALRQALDDIAVEDGKCNWAEVANILPRMRGELRAYTPQRLSAETAIAALAKRFWSIHPSTLDDMGLTREEFYASEMVKMFGALTRNEPQGVSQSSADSGGEWHIQQSVPSDGFECYYLLRDDVVVAEICGPQTEQRTRHLNALVIAANSSAEPQELPDREAIEAILQDEVFCRRDGTYSYGNAATRILAACSVSRPQSNTGATT